MFKYVDKLTWFLVILNVLGFGVNYMMNGQAIMMGRVSPQQLLDAGAMNGDTPLYTWVTSMFQHGSVIHILMNMLALISLGPVVRLIYGNSVYLIGYFLSGLTGSFVNVLFAPDTVQVGASGAICGLMGMLLMAAIFSPKRRYLDLSSILGSIGFMVIATLSNPNISVTGHGGGLVGGLVVGLVFSLGMYLIKNKEKDT